MIAVAVVVVFGILSFVSFAGWMTEWDAHATEYERSMVLAAEAADLERRVQELIDEKLKLVADLQEANRRLKKIWEVLK